MMNGCRFEDILMKGWLFDLRVRPEHEGYRVTYRAARVGTVRAVTDERFDESLLEAAVAAADAAGHRDGYFVKRAMKEIKDQIYDLKQDCGGVR